MVRKYAEAGFVGFGAVVVVAGAYGAVVKDEVGIGAGVGLDIRNRGGFLTVEAGVIGLRLGVGIGDIKRFVGQTGVWGF